MQIPPAPEGELAPGLYVVSTPIGNLRDLTFRALDVLTRCDLVLAEDTRVAGKLLSAYGLKKKVIRYDDHAGEAARPRILMDLKEGKRVALISDAGTPLVSDPGFKLTKEAAHFGATVIPVPGASAPLAALAIAGLPTDRFLFSGFLPQKSAARRTALEELGGVRATLVFFESGPRLRASLEDMAAVLGGEREAAVARELTKLYETCIRGSLAELAVHEKLDAPKGEIVVVVGPGREEEATADDVDRALTEALTRMGPSEAAAETAKALGLPRRALYRRALELKGSG
jgi:16S rRNA (cytidine1402-2'-O)-methyltransferase